MQVGQLTEHWRQLYREELANVAWVAKYKELDELRVVDQKEMLELLNSYLTGHISTEELRATFDRKTRKDWDTFGFKGMSNDQNKMWNGEKLGDLSLKKFPNLWMDSEFQQIISLIDILWLKGINVVTAAFEIEHTTSIYSGLLRMSDLVALYPNINFPLYIVTPNVRLDKVRRELSRPTFQALELHKRCGFFSEEKLLQEAEHIMRWANHPSAIERLAAKVNDIVG